MKTVAVIVPGGIGNRKNQELVDILGSKNTFTFRNNLDIKTNSIYKKCVCSLNPSPLAKL